MSRASRRMMKKHRRMAEHAGENQEKALEVTEKERQDLQQLFEKEQYADYINCLAEVVQEGRYNAEILYQGAYSYFMLGDYMRAANMINDVITLMPGHVAARILLARICLLDDRTDDGLAIIDFVLENYKQQLSEKQKADFRDLLDYYADTEAEHIRADFPQVAAFLQMSGLLSESETTEMAEGDVERVSDIEETGKSAKAISGAGTTGESFSAGDVLNGAGYTASTPNVETEIRQIMDQPVGLLDKVRLLNAFAAAHFAAGAAEYEAARLELAQACRLDAASQETLRNMAVLAKCEGRQEEAMELASRLQQRDFLLLAFLLKN